MRKDKKFTSQEILLSQALAKLARAGISCKAELMFANEEADEKQSTQTFDSLCQDAKIDTIAQQLIRVPHLVSGDYVEITLLQASCWYNKINLVKYITKKAPELNYTTALIAAAEAANAAVVEYLLSLPSLDANRQDEKEHTVFYYALTAQDALLVQTILLLHGATLTQKDSALIQQNVDWNTRYKQAISSATKTIKNKLKKELTLTNDEIQCIRNMPDPQRLDVLKCYFNPVIIENIIKKDLQKETEEQIFSKVMEIYQARRQTFAAEYAQIQPQPDLSYRASKLAQIELDEKQIALYAGDSKIDDLAMSNIQTRMLPRSTGLEPIPLLFFAFWIASTALAKWLVTESPGLLHKTYFDQRAGSLVQNQTLLMLAAAGVTNNNDNIPLVIFLLEQNLDVNAKNDWEDNALVVACSVHKPEVAAVLLRFGAELTETQMQRLQNINSKAYYETAFNLAMTECISNIADSKPLRETEVAFLMKNLELFKFSFKKQTEELTQCLALRLMKNQLSPAEINSLLKIDFLQEFIINFICNDYLSIEKIKIDSVPDEVIDPFIVLKTRQHQLQSAIRQAKSDGARDEKEHEEAQNSQLVIFLNRVKAVKIGFFGTTSAFLKIEQASKKAYVLITAHFAATGCPMLGLS